MPSNQTLADIADFFGLYTFKDDLIYFCIENHDNWRHREVAVKKDPMLNAYIIKFNQELLAERPIFVPNIFAKKPISSISEVSGERNGRGRLILDQLTPASPDINGEYREYQTDVSDDWNNENWEALLNEIFDMARIHTFCVVRLYRTPPWWRVFTFREITEIKYDENDKPIGCKVEWSKSLPLSHKYMNHKEEFNFYDENKIKSDPEFNAGSGLLIPFGDPHGNELGVFDLENIWTLDIYLRYIVLDIINNSAKCSGFYHLIYGDAVSPDTQKKLQNALDMVAATRSVAAKRSVLEEIKAMFPAKPEFSALALEKVLKLFSAAARLPLSYFNSETEAGTIFSENSGDEIKINKKKRYVFKQFKNAIISLVKMRWGIIVDDVFPNIQEEEKEDYESVKIEAQNPKREGDILNA